MIAVEDLTVVDDDEQRDIDRWERLGRRLAELDPVRFRRTLALAAGFVSIYECPDESEEAFNARLRLATGTGGAS